MATRNHPMWAGLLWLLCGCSPCGAPAGKPVEPASAEYRAPSPAVAAPVAAPVPAAATPPDTTTASAPQAAPEPAASPDPAEAPAATARPEKQELGIHGRDAAAQRYPYYPALDLRRVPYHVAAGKWGARDPIAAPARPQIRDEVTLKSGAEFERVRASGRRIVVPRGVTVPPATLHGVNDVEIVIADGAAVRGLNLGNNQRVFIHGAVIGKHNAGRLDGIDAGYAGKVTDLIVDGLDSAPPSAQGSFLVGTTHPLERVSITNMRIYGGLGLWDGGGTDVVLAGNNMFNHTTWWIWRIDGSGRFDRIVMFQNYLVTIGQPVLRLHRPAKLWIGENTWVNSTQFHPDSTGFVLRMDGSDGAAVWFENGRVHSRGSLGVEFHPARAGAVAFYRCDETTTLVADAWGGGPPPGKRDEWYVKPKVVPTAKNALPPWSERNASGDPRELAR